MCVHATVMRQTTTDGERLVVHLFNDLNMPADHALPVDDVPLREESVPIHDIRVACDSSLGIGRFGRASVSRARGGAAGWMPDFSNIDTESITKTTAEIQQVYQE